MSAWTRRSWIGIGALATLAVVVALIRIMIDRQLDGTFVLAWPGAEVARFRYSAVMAGCVAGAALAIAGVLLQALLRNPLACPFVLGVSSGSALFVMLAIYAAYAAGVSGMVRPDDHMIAAVAGALCTLVLVFSLGRKRGWIDPLSLVLVGVVVSAVCGALIMFLYRLVPPAQGADFFAWMTGYVPEAPRRWALNTATIGVAIGFVAGIALGPPMDVATLGDDEARSAGLELPRLRLVIFMLAGVLAALAVMLVGPIGFVGLIAPHVVRTIMGPRHGPLVVGSALVGVILIVGADVARQVIHVGSGRLPVGIFTALIGGPTFVWLLRSSHRVQT